MGPMDISLDVEPLLLAAGMVSLVFKFYNFVKQVSAAAPKPEKARRVDSITTGGRVTKANKKGPVQPSATVPVTKPAVSARTVLARVWQCSVLLVSVGIVAVLVVWKGAATTTGLLVLLFCSAHKRGTKGWVLIDLATATTVCLLLSLVTLLHTEGMDALVSTDPTIQAHRTISSAVAFIKDGGTVRVLPGTYHEQVILAKSLTLAGLGTASSDVVISFDGHGPTVVVTNDVSIENLSIEKNSRWQRTVSADGPDTPAPIGIGGSVFGGSGVDHEDRTCDDTVVMLETDGASRNPSPVCLYFFGGHPLLEEVVRNVEFGYASRSVESPEPRVLAELLMSQKVTQVFCDGSVQFANDFAEILEPGTVESSAVNRLKWSARRHTPPHVITVGVVVNWLDASAHWIVLLASLCKEHGTPVLIEAADHAWQLGDIFYRAVASFATGVFNVPTFRPEPPNQIAFEAGALVYNMAGWVIVLSAEYIASFATDVVFPTAMSVAGYLQFIPWVGYIIVDLVVSFLRVYLYVSQYLQVILHAGWFVVTVFLLWSGELTTLSTESYLQKGMSFTKNLPMVAAVASMVVCHVALPIQSTHTLLKRINGGRLYSKPHWWAALLIVRVLLTLYPGPIFAMLAALFFLLRSSGPKKQDLAINGAQARSSTQVEPKSTGSKSVQPKAPSPQKTKTSSLDTTASSPLVKEEDPAMQILASPVLTEGKQPAGQTGYGYAPHPAMGYPPMTMSPPTGGAYPPYAAPPSLPPQQFAPYAAPPIMPCLPPSIYAPPPPRQMPPSPYSPSLQNPPEPQFPSPTFVRTCGPAAAAAAAAWIADRRAICCFRNGITAKRAASSVKKAPEPMLRWLFSRGVAQENPEVVADEAEVKLSDAEDSLEEIRKCIADAEAEAVRLEEKERELREEGERLVMEAHDDVLGSVSPEARRLVAKEVANVLREVAKKTEDLELRVLKLEIQRAALLGQQRKGQELLRDLGRLDPMSSVDIPAYPNIVGDTPTDDANPLTALQAQHKEDEGSSPSSSAGDRCAE
eukprot:gene3648-5676_t